MKFVFISREGKDSAGARIRSYGWANALRKRYNLDTEVLSFVDALGGVAGVKEKGFGLTRKIRIMAKSIPVISRYKKPCCFVINRLNYHSLPAGLIGRLKNFYLVFDVDDWEAKDISQNKSFSFAEYLMRYFAKKSSFCLGASKFLVGYLRQYNKKVYYLPTGVSEEFLVYSSIDNDSERRKVILSWHGTFNRKENLDEMKTLLHVFSLLKQRKFASSIELRIKGGGFFCQEILSLIKSIKDKDILFFPWSSWQNINSYLDQADIGVVPLEDTIYNRAKSPTKIFEYMARKKPVVASYLGEAKNIIDDGVDGMLCRDKDEFVDKLAKLVRDRQRIYEMGELAYLKVKRNYSLSTIVDKLNAIIKENGLA